MPPNVPVVIRLYYDFASSLCYVAHRVVERLLPETRRIGVEFEWTPLDLAALLNWRRGARVPADRIANVERVADELGVPLRIPERWLDSRAAMAIGLATSAPERAATWRERVFTAVFEEGVDPGEVPECLRLAQQIGLEVDEDRIEAGYDALELHTRTAADQEVTGVPTFMLGQWPFGGIHDERAMISILERFVERRSA